MIFLVLILICTCMVLGGRLGMLAIDRDRWKARAQRNTELLRANGIKAAGEFEIKKMVGGMVGGLPAPAPLCGKPAPITRPTGPPPKPVDLLLAKKAASARPTPKQLDLAVNALMAREAETRLTDIYGHVSRARARKHIEATFDALGLKATDQKGN